MNFQVNALLIGLSEKYDVFRKLSNKECTYPFIGNNFNNIINQGYEDIMKFKAYPMPDKTFYNIPLFLWYIIRIIEIPFTYSNK